MKSMPLRETFLQRDVRAVIKFLFLLEKSAAEVHQGLEECLQECAMSYETVRRWIRRSKEGNLDRQRVSLWTPGDSNSRGRESCQTA